MREKEIIKQDINFLEHNLWSPRERDKKIVYQTIDSDRYKLISYDGLPNKVDMMILYYLLLFSQNKRYKRTIKLSMYEILNGCNIHPNPERKERLKESLERWKNVSINFQGVFYNGVEYEQISFGILDTWSIVKGENKVEIKFNEEWLYKIKNSNFFKYISFTEMKDLRSPIAIRLYEILSKSFYKRDRWEISSQKLAVKIPLSQKYHSKIIEKIKPAVKIINEKTSLNIKMNVKKTKKNDGIITFQKVSKSLLDIMKEEQKIEGIKQEKGFDKEKLLKSFTDKEIEQQKKEYIEKELPKNKYLTKIHNQKGFNKIIEMSFLSYLNTKKEL
jgi:hypothetical protein